MLAQKSPIVAMLSLALLAAPAGVGVARAAFAQSQPDAGAQDEPQQVTLTDASIENLLAAKKDMDAALAKVPESAAEQPDAKTMAALDGVAKAHKFANYGEYDDTANTIGAVLAGIDPATKKYVGPEAMIKQQIAEVQADKTLKPKDKKDALDELKAELKAPVSVKNPGNIDVVLNHYDTLTAALSDDQ